MYAHGPTYAVLMDGQPTLNTDSSYFKSENGYTMYLLNGTLTFANSEVESTNNTAALFQDGTYNLNSGKFHGHSDYYDLYKTPSGSATINLNPEVVVTKKNW